MFRTLLDKTNQFRQRLTRLDDQPLSRAALVVIIFLDLFILSSIYSGLADHTRQLTTPYEYIPPLCQDIVIDLNWNDTNRLDKLTQLVTRYEARRYSPDYYQQFDVSKEHPVCAPIVSAFVAIRNDADLTRSLSDLRRIERETSDLRAGLERTKGAYDTQLLEKIAGENKPGTGTGSIKKQIDVDTSAMDALIKKEGLLRQSLAQDPKILAFFRRVDGVSEADRKALGDELRRLNFWFPAERLGMEMLFLLPLLGAFYFWNNRSLTRNRPFQVLVSSHLLVVTMIPVLSKILVLVYDIIPRKLIRHIIEVLEAFKLVAIWHYLVIAGAIVVAMALIYLFQKKLFSHERLMLRRIAKGECHACGLRLPSGSRYCPACGAAQYRICEHCDQPTLVHGRYCTICGESAD